MEVTKHNIMHYFYERYPQAVTHEEIQEVFNLPIVVTTVVLQDLWSRGKLLWYSEYYRIGETHYNIMREGIEDGTLEFGADSTNN